MNVRELMIGNFIKYGSNICEVKSMSTKNIVIKSIADGRTILSSLEDKSLNPIKINNEVLFDCPEILKDHSMEIWRIRQVESQFHLMQKGDRFVFRGVGMSIIYVDTLHHLQNLVYVNTGIPLEFNIRIKKSKL